MKKSNSKISLVSSKSNISGKTDNISKCGIESLSSVDTLIINGELNLMRKKFTSFQELNTATSSIIRRISILYLRFFFFFFFMSLL
jgi:hypothetical protein